MAAFAVFCQFLVHYPVLIQFLFHFLFQFLFTVLLAGPQETKLSVNRFKKAKTFSLFLIDSQKAWFSWPCQQNRE